MKRNRLYGQLSAIFFGLLLLCSNALARLGGDLGSIELDRAVFAGEYRISNSGQGYRIHELRTARGTVIREYLEPVSSRVFAVSWAGQVAPSFAVLLGDYSDEHAEAMHAEKSRILAAASEEHPRVRTPLRRVRTGRLAVDQFARPGYFAGRACLLPALPAGMSCDAIPY